MRVYAKIYRVVASIKRGKVMTYEQVAAKAGTIARVVGNAMRAARDKGLNVRWWRVMRKAGDKHARISPKAPNATQVQQKKMLKKEGVNFGAGERVNLRKPGG